MLLVIELLAKTDLSEHLPALTPRYASNGIHDIVTTAHPSLCYRNEREAFSLPHTLLSYCRQVAAGLDYLSRKGFIHRDIAARNILLSEDYEICKVVYQYVRQLSIISQIADFGMSRDLADETYYISSGGKIPVKWTAPEVCCT